MFEVNTQTQWFGSCTRRAAGRSRTTCGALAVMSSRSPARGSKNAGRKRQHGRTFACAVLRVTATRHRQLPQGHSELTNCKETTRIATTYKALYTNKSCQPLSTQTAAVRVRHDVLMQRGLNVSPGGGHRFPHSLSACRVSVRATPARRAPQLECNKGLNPSPAPTYQQAERMPAALAPVNTDLLHFSTQSWHDSSVVLLAMPHVVRILYKLNTT